MADLTTLAVLQSDHDMLVELRTLMNRLLSDVKDMGERVNADATDIDGRVRALENFKWWVMGASVAIGFLGSLVGKAVFH